MIIIEKVNSRTSALEAGIGLDPELALSLEGLTGAQLFELLPLTNHLRRHHHGAGMALCAISNAKSGRCPENCAFCAQSSSYDTGVRTFPLLGTTEFLGQAEAARRLGAENFSVVTSGTAVTSPSERAEISRMIAGMVEMGLKPCASLGFLDPEMAADYRSAGLRHYHHNLETAASFFPEICSSHDYERALETVRTAKQAGLYVCSGGIMGLGENWAHRVELAETLRELQVDSLPLNFLQPVPGTPLAEEPGLDPLEALATVVLFRLMLPQVDLRICGGRERTFGDFQALLPAAGANGLMIGNYLTTQGRQWAQDQRLLKDWARLDKDE